MTRKAAAETAKDAKANLHVVQALPAVLAEHFDASVVHYEYPAFNLNGTAECMLSKAVRDARLKVVLPGEGSDEIFAGCELHAHTAMRTPMLDVACWVVAAEPFGSVYVAACRFVLPD
jgi:asparagine synthetase B (glutamine-hydrolysing)